MTRDELLDLLTVERFAPPPPTHLPIRNHEPITLVDPLPVTAERRRAMLADLDEYEKRTTEKRTA